VAAAILQKQISFSLLHQVSRDGALFLAGKSGCLLHNNLCGPHVLSLERQLCLVY
jgi:hypothetical protein